MPQASSKPLRSGALAKATGLSSDTIRYYERIGVLSPAQRTSSGYRLYAPDSLDRIRIVQKALRFGFRLAELAQILHARDSGDVPCKQVYALARAKLMQARADLKELKKTEKLLRSLLSSWNKKITTAGPNQRARLLDSLKALEDQPAKPHHKFNSKGESTK